jgi:hypothetical protein
VQRIIEPTCKKGNNFTYTITTIIGDILPFKAFVICKTELPSWFSCKIDIFWVVPFLQNGGSTQQMSSLLILKVKACASHEVCKDLGLYSFNYETVISKAQNKN